MQLRTGLSTPSIEHGRRIYPVLKNAEDETKRSYEQLKKESLHTQGKVAGAAVGAGLGAGYLLKKTKGGTFKGRGIGKGVRGKAALLAGAVGAGYGSLLGGAVGGHVRKGKKKDLAARLEELHEFAAPVRSVTKLMKTSKRNPLAIRKTTEGEFRVAQKGSATAGPMGYYTDDISDARNTAAVLLKKERRQMKTRSKDLAARLEELHEFVSLVRERGSDSLYDGEDCGPTMYVSGLADPEVMSMPKEGTAMVRYKVRSRSVNERGDMPTYGADIAISTLEPVKPAAGKKEMGVLERLREFARGDQLKKLMPGGFRVSAPDGYNDLILKRDVAGAVTKANVTRKAAGLPKLDKRAMKPWMAARRHEVANLLKQSGTIKNRNVVTKKDFAGRERNPSGQFISGVSSNPDDMAMAYKKKVGKMAGAAVLGGGAAMAAMPAGRAALGRAGQSMLRGAGRVLIR